MKKYTMVDGESFRVRTEHEGTKRAPKRKGYTFIKLWKYSLNTERT